MEQGQKMRCWRTWRKVLVLGAVFMFLAGLGIAAYRFLGRSGIRTPEEPLAALVVAPAQREDFAAPEILGMPTADSIVVNVLPAGSMEVAVEYGTSPVTYTKRSSLVDAAASAPREILLEGLEADTRYYYRVIYRMEDQETIFGRRENTFITQRASGSPFVFDIQGDSHPERSQQFSADLYRNTLRNVLADQPDFYFTMGDDFSVDTMKSLTQANVEQLYRTQRTYLGLVGGSAPLFLVNGNHEQAARYLLDGTPDNVAVWAQNARNSLYSQPLPGGFYTGDEEAVGYIGLLRDYYAFTWGDALFVVIDPYWHSPVPVDNSLNNSEKRSNLWDVTLGDAQYAWLKKTLEESGAKYKFVFSHHVLGTGRGGIENASLYEWGGEDKKGAYGFPAERPGWGEPIQQLMARTGVTIFFQGHDHVFARQELDGVVYQTLPEPADPNDALYNRDAFKSGIVFANSGHLRVRVSPQEVVVEYVFSSLNGSVQNGASNDGVVVGYSVKP